MSSGALQPSSCGQRARGLSSCEGVGSGCVPMSRASPEEKLPSAKDVEPNARFEVECVQERREDF